MYYKTNVVYLNLNSINRLKSDCYHYISVLFHRQIKAAEYLQMDIIHHDWGDLRFFN